MKWLLMVQGVFLFLTSALTQGSAQFRCFTTPSSVGELNCGTIDGEFVAASIEECCLSPNGQFFEPRGGPESCTACIVFGWFHGTDITLSERTSTYDLQAGFIKGGAVQTFVTAQGFARFEIAVEERGAVEGVNADFIVQDTLHLLLYGPNPSPFDVPITVRVDGIALEPAERFTLSLDPINPTATFILAGGQPGLFVIPEISVVIRNLEKVEVEFSSPMYTVDEGNGTVTVCLTTNTAIAQPLTVTVIPLQKAHGNIATAVADFGIAPRQVIFPATNSRISCTTISIVDDEIAREGNETFFVVFNLPATPSGAVEGDIAQAWVVIIDNDVTTIEFDSPDYTVIEDNGTVTVCLTTNRGIASALDVEVVASFKPSSSNPASDGDFEPDTRTITFPVSTTAYTVCTSFVITDDTITLEGHEQFRVDFTAPAGTQRGVIDTACVTIIDDDALCLDPPIIRNGMRTFTGNSIGDTATYTCNPGFELIGDPTTTCTAAMDGNSATYPAVPPPECRPLCDDPPIIVNGMRTFTGNSVGDTATYSCDPGFKLIGESTTTCTIALDGNSATFPDIPPPECMNSDQGFFQVQIGPVDHCVTWTPEKIKAVEDDIQITLAEVVINECKCKFALSNILVGQFSCRTTPTQVTYRSTILGTAGYNASYLLDILQGWVESGPTITARQLLLDVSSNCPVRISFLSDPDCPVSNSQPLGDPTLITSDPKVIQCVHVCLLRTQGRGICGV